MEEGAGRRQDTFGLREIGLNLSTTQGDAASMMYTQDSTVDTVMQPIGVATSREASGAAAGVCMHAAGEKALLAHTTDPPSRRPHPSASPSTSGNTARTANQ